VLNEARVAFCVDTNVFVEFEPLDQIPWRQLAPNATAIHIIVVTKVGEEMDEHKRKTGRLRRRALEFAQIARSIEESTERRAVLRDSNPLVTIEFAPIYRRAELDGDLYDLDDKDGRIVAEVARFRKDSPGAVLLSDDSKPRRLARQTGLPCECPPGSWRREEGPDERDKEIADLKRELGARPRFSISFLRSCRRNTYYLSVVPSTSCSVCATQLASAVLRANSKVSRNQLIKRHGLERSGPLGMALPFTSKLTPSQLDAYDQKYQTFEANITRWAHAQSEIFSGLGSIMPIDVEVTNSGDRVGEKVLVDMELQGEFHFASPTLAHHITGERVAPPDPPKPHNIYDNLPNLSGLEQPRPHDFYILDTPKMDESTTLLQWRCEEFRHGRSFIFPVSVRATRCGARGVLKVSVSSTAVAKATKAQAPLICVLPESKDIKLCAYLEARTALFPQRFQDPVRHAIAAARQACGTKSAECQDGTPHEA
jgi:hypothetical protein